MTNNGWNVINLILASCIAILSVICVFQIIKIVDVFNWEEQKFFIADEYKDSFAATCAITHIDDEDFEYGGSGTLLSNGKILTAKHVPDGNRNGIIEEDEKEMLLKFYYPKEFTCIGRVIFSPEEKNVIGLGHDFCIIKPDLPIGSNIKLESLSEHYSLGAGEEIYTVGRKDCDNPTITFGHEGTIVKGNEIYNRAELDIWYGNSGGGVFKAKNGKLLGTVSIKRTARLGGLGGPLNPDVWAGYIGADIIRAYLRLHDKEFLVEDYRDTYDYKAKKNIYCFLILLNCFLGVHFGYPVLGEEVQCVRRVNGAV